MSALARYFHIKGLQVAGYDRTITPLTREMEAEGISVHYIEDITQIPDWVLNLPKEQVLVIITPAVPVSHAEYVYFSEKGYRMVKRSEVLGMITRDTFGIGIAGTHGKTTTTAMTSHLLEVAELKPAAFVGGIMANYDTNYLPGTGGISVVEADEFDRSFLRLSPSVAVITAMDPDHLDIYGSEAEFREGFLAYARKLGPDGKLIVHESLRHYFSGFKIITYGFSSDADVRAVNISVKDGRFIFNIEGLFPLSSLSLGMPGRHNVSNATAALTAAWIAGAQLEKLPDAVSSFKGVKRRFEFISVGKKIYVDDYAHHPKELDACISAARELFPEKKIFGAFQPHLFSRTRDFAPEFSKSLSQLDYVYLLPIYPARELPITGISSEMLAQNITAPCEVVSKADLAKSVSLDMGNFDVFLTMGAGDIDQLVSPLKQLFDA